MSDKHPEHPADPKLHHNPKEGYDQTEPAAPKIAFFVIGSILLLVLTIVALQQYFDSVWFASVEQKVLEAPAIDLQTHRNLEDWRMTHYEYTTPSKTAVRIPLAQAREAFLKDAAEGKTFYPAKPTVPKPEEPAQPAGAAPAAAGQQNAQPNAKQEAKQAAQPAAKQEKK